jgi:hypothetical protein
MFAVIVVKQLEDLRPRIAQEPADQRAEAVDPSLSTAFFVELE